VDGTGTDDAGGRRDCGKKRIHLPGVDDDDVDGRDRPQGCAAPAVAEQGPVADQLTGTRCSDLASVDVYGDVPAGNDEGLLAEVGLEQGASKLPSEISGGMRKRAGFARAMVLDPDIVLFDEPDSGLDPVRTSLLNDVILAMHERHKGTYMVVTHDMKTTRKVSDYVGVIWKGKCIHYSSADEAFESDNPFVRQFLAGESAGPLGMD